MIRRTASFLCAWLEQSPYRQNTPCQPPPYHATHKTQAGCCYNSFTLYVRLYVHRLPHQPACLSFPFSLPFLFIRQNRLVRRPPKSSNNCVGIYISYTFYHLLHHFSSAVPTLKLYSHLRDVGSMLAPCLYGCGFVPSGHFSTE